MNKINTTLERLKDFIVASDEKIFGGELKKSFHLTPIDIHVVFFKNKFSVQITSYELCTNLFD